MSQQKMLWYLFMTLNMQKVVWFYSKKPPLDSNYEGLYKICSTFKEPGLFIFYARDDILISFRASLIKIFNYLYVPDFIVFIFVE